MDKDNNGKSLSQLATKVYYANQLIQSMPSVREIYIIDDYGDQAILTSPFIATTAPSGVLPFKKLSYIRKLIQRLQLIGKIW